MNPFGNTPVDLKNRKLTKDEKAWLGKQIFHKACGTKALAFYYNRNIRTLQKFSLSVKLGKPLKDKGRPKVFDDASLQSLKASYIDNLRDGEVSSAKKCLEDDLIDQYKVCCGQKRSSKSTNSEESDASHLDAKVLSRRTKKRYMAMMLDHNAALK